MSSAPPPRRDDVEATAAELLRLLRAASDSGPSTSSWRRALRLAGVATGTLSALAGGRLRGLVAPDAAAARREGEALAAARLVTSLGSMKGIAMKVGQMLSYIDHSVPEEARRLLAMLQTQSQPTPFAEVRRILETELGEALETRFARLDPTPIASASIGQVHRGRLRSGEEVAVKVQHPAIEQAIDADLGNLALVGRLQALALPRADLQGVLRELRARFAEECDYRHEAAMQERFAALFADHPLLVVPRVFHEHSARRVLTTAFYEGRTFQELLAADPPQAVRDRVGAALCSFYLGALYRHGTFNADPHPGNYLFPDDGRIVMLDYGCVRQYDAVVLERIKALLRAVVADDRDAMHAACVDMGLVAPGARYDREAARDFLRYLYAPALRQGPHRLDREYTRAVLGRYLRSKSVFELTLPGELLFLNRVNLGLMSIVVDLGAEIDWQGLGLGFAAGHDPTATEAQPPA